MYKAVLETTSKTVDSKHKVCFKILNPTDKY